MRFKTPEVENEFCVRELLCKIAREFAEYSLSLGVHAIMTRMLEDILGATGVHPDGRAVDFRDEYTQGSFLYTHEQREKLVTLFNSRYPRKDGKPTVLWHSFNGGPHHFHIQVPKEMATYEGHRSDFGGAS